MPAVRKGEKQQEYVSRCIPEVMGEGRDQKASAGKCYGMYKEALKRRMERK